MGEHFNFKLTLPRVCLRSPAKVIFRLLAKYHDAVSKLKPILNCNYKTSWKINALLQKQLDPLKSSTFVRCFVTFSFFLNAPSNWWLTGQESNKSLKTVWYSGNVFLCTFWGAKKVQEPDNIKIRLNHQLRSYIQVCNSTQS